MARKVPRLLSYLERASPFPFGAVENGRKVSSREMQSLSFGDSTGEAKKKLGLIVDRAKRHQDKMLGGVSLVCSAVVLTNMVEKWKRRKPLDDLVKRIMKLKVEVEALQNDVNNVAEVVNALVTELDGLLKEVSAIEEGFALDEKEVMLEDDLDALVERQEVLHKAFAAFRMRSESIGEESGGFVKRAEAVWKEIDAISKELNSILKT